MSGQPSPESTLGEETRALGDTLKAIADRDPAGVPAAATGAVFGAWLSAAGEKSRHPEYFADVAANYDPAEHTNRDLFNLFSMLEMHVPADEPPGGADPLSGTFVPLPIVQG